MLDRRRLPQGLTFSRWTAADGWPMRRYDWPADGTPRGSLLFQSGRADYIEKQVEALAHWHEAGWSISGFDWRGQGGSGRLVEGVPVGHLGSFEPLVDDFAQFVAAWKGATRGPHVLVGHSMGGHIMLRHLAGQPGAADAVVLVAPMLGLAVPRPVKLVAWAACQLGLSMRPVSSDVLARAPQHYLTGCADRYADSGWWRETRPELVLGVPSWGWLMAAYNSLARLWRPGVLEGVTTPTLLLSPSRDRLVSVAAIRRAAKRLPDARLTVHGGAHELLREGDAVRQAVLADIDGFLDERVPR